MAVLKLHYLFVCLFSFVCLESFNVVNAKRKIINEINICKRNDPDLSQCYCNNFKKIIPLLKNGQPDMNIVPLDPIIVSHIKIELPETNSVRLTAHLTNATVEGLSELEAEICKADITEDGIQVYIQTHIPKVVLTSSYKAKGKFLLVTMDADSTFKGTFTDLHLNTIWNSTRYMKNNKEHLKFTNNIRDMTIKTIKIHFNDILGPNTTEISENINETINSNIDLLYDEIKPVILETIGRITLTVVNDLYSTFSFEELYPTK